MPKYVYKCLKCEKICEVVHSFSEKKTNCSEITECEVNYEIERVPQQINYSTKKATKKTTHGQIVDEFIKETKKEVKEYNKDMRDWKPE